VDEKGEMAVSPFSALDVEIAGHVRRMWDVFSYAAPQAAGVSIVDYVHLSRGQQVESGKRVAPTWAGAAAGHPFDRSKRPSIALPMRDGRLANDLRSASS
jgi:hypothetical protein